jgi:hypothetical protein
VLGRIGDKAGIDFWTDTLDRHSASLASVLVNFSESAENRAWVQGAIRGGVPYLESGVPYPPVAVGTGPAYGIAGGTVGLDGSESTVAAGKTATYAWSLASRPAGSTATLVLQDSAQPYFIPDKPGDYVFSLTVSDGAASSKPAMVSIPVKSSADIGPVTPPPGALWQPPAGATPLSSNFVYLESEVGDVIGKGATLVYTDANAKLRVDGGRSSLSIYVFGDIYWTGQFTAMAPLSQLKPGYYDTHELVGGGMGWSGGGSSCRSVSGWFIVDSISYANGFVSAVDLRFEQHCNGAAAALHGKIQWLAAPSDPQLPPGPTAPPAGLWQPVPGKTPATGNYLYLENVDGEFGNGRNFLYTDNAKLAVGGQSNGLGYSVNVPERWTGRFTGMSSLAQLQPGYYGGLHGEGQANPAKGSIQLGGGPLWCTTVSGWFVIDQIGYADGKLTSVDMRFEELCDGGSVPVHGKVHWTATTP